MVYPQTGYPATLSKMPSCVVQWCDTVVFHEQDDSDCENGKPCMQLVQFCDLHSSKQYHGDLFQAQGLGWHAACQNRNIIFIGCKLLHFSIRKSLMHQILNRLLGSSSQWKKHFHYRIGKADSTLEIIYFLEFVQSNTWNFLNFRIICIKKIEVLVF